MGKLRDTSISLSKTLGVHRPLKDLKMELWARSQVAKLEQKPLSEQKKTVYDGAHAEKRTETVCMFSSFDAQSQVDDHVIYYLTALRDQLKADIIFVTTSASLSMGDVEKLRPVCRRIVHRENIGHDFGSWKAGMELTPDWESYAYLILANDSVYGPFTRLDVIYEKLRTNEPTIVGITENFEFEQHLQSYFLAFNRAAYTSRFFRRFWRRYRFFAKRELLIELYELGISRQAQRAGVKLRPLIPYAPMRDLVLSETPLSFAAQHARTRGVNPTHYFWRELITRWQGPFLKADLLRMNPISAPDVGEAIAVVQKHTTYPVDLIRRHQARVKPEVKARN